MEIVLVVMGSVALVGLVSLTLRRRGARGNARRSPARPWRGSAGAFARTGSRRPATATTAGGAPVAFASMSGGGVAVQDPPRTRTGAEPDLDAWDDDLEWTDDLDASPADDPSAGRQWGTAVDAPSQPDEPPAPAPEPPAAAAARPPVADPPPAADVPAAEAAHAQPAREDDWDDDLQPAPFARPDGERPFPETRGAAAFGAATAAPPAQRPRRGGVLRSPVMLVTLYAAAGIALVVLAVSLLSEGVSPRDSESGRQASDVRQPTPEPQPADPAPQTSADKEAAAARAREQQAAFRRAVRAAVSAERRAAASARAARERRLRAAARRRAAERRRREARQSAAAPDRTSPPSYRPAQPVVPPPPPPPAPSGGGGGGGACEFCIG